jgi:uncharacterized protein
MEKLVNKAKDYVKQLRDEEPTGHDFHHALRVYNNALYLSVGKDVDLLVISLAALLHDLDDPKISSKDSHLAEDFLKQNLEEKKQREVMDIIESISFTKQKHGVYPESLEGKIVQDADRLDALGAIGIARCFAYTGNKQKLIYNESIDDDSAIAHFYQKLLNLDIYMNTTEAKIIAENRIKYMKNFLEVFFNEWR